MAWPDELGEFGAGLWPVIVRLNAPTSAYQSLQQDL